jgi:hypothetical protein
MAFDAGLLCCSNLACALVKTDGNWEKLPHQTEITFNGSVTSAGVVTSDTNGREAKSCGTVATTGTLGLACHDGDEARFELNTKYKIRFSKDCDAIWDPELNSNEGGPVAAPVSGTYYEGIVLITGEPVNYNISASDTPIAVYTWELDGDWIEQPATIAPDLT